MKNVIPRRQFLRASAAAAGALAAKSVVLAEAAD